jgi:superfamily II DNA helicase RecQ
MIRRSKATLWRSKRATEPLLDAVALAYERRLADDRDRIQAMMHYAQSTSCRPAIIERYFAEEPKPDCGRCDNCVTDAAHAFAG